MRNRYSDDIVVTATLRSDGTGFINVKMGNPNNANDAIVRLIQACQQIQSKNEYRSYSECPDSEYTWNR